MFQQAPNKNNYKDYTNNNQQVNNKGNNINLVTPYTKGLSESFKNICNKLRI